MEEKTGSISAWIERLEKYIRATFELYKLKAVDKLADIVSSLVARLVVALFAVMFFLMVNIAVSLWVGELLGKTYLGFFAVSGLYALLGIIFYVFRDRLIRKPVSDAIVKEALK